MSTVMIAEDDLLMADMLEEVLVENGYEACGIVRTVDEGIELSDRCKPDFAILDIRLAEGGLGMDIAARLHTKEGIGILYASGNSSQMSLTKDDGAALLRKPYRAEDMVRALKIVEQIINTGEKSRPFPKGFSLLSGSSPKSGTLHDSTDDNVASAAERYECSRLNGVQERTMTEFRCKMLNEHGRILFSSDITADTVDGAIRQAAEVLHTSNLSSPSRRVYAFEVWSGESRLFPPLLNA